MRATRLERNVAGAPGFNPTMIRRVLLVGLAGLAAFAAPAAAAPTQITRSGELALGPRLAGERLFYGEIYRGSVRVTLAGRDEPRQRLAFGSVPFSSFADDDEEPGGYSFARSSLAASPERLAYAEVHGSGNARYQQGVTRLERMIGAHQGGLRPLETCDSNNPNGPAAAAVDADGRHVATTDCAGRIEIREHPSLDEGITRVDPGPGLAVGTLALAGRYVAYNAYGLAPGSATPATTVVYDWVAGSKLYEVPRQASFDLQADGKLAAASVPSGDRSCTQGRLAWFSPQEPTEHVLPVTPCSEQATIAADRIAVVTRAGEERTVSLVALDGTQAEAARLGDARIQRGTHDFDGTRIAYALGNCLGGADLFVESAAAPQPRAVSPVCPIRVVSGSAPVGPGDTSVPVAVECELGCYGSVEIRMRVGGQVRTVGERRVRVAPDDPCGALGLSVEVELSPAARRELRRRKRLNANAVARGADRTGRPRRESRTLRLRATSRNRAAPGDCSV